MIEKKDDKERLLVPLTEDAALKLGFEKPPHTKFKPALTYCPAGKLKENRQNRGLWCKPVKPVREDCPWQHGTKVSFTSKKEYDKYLKQTRVSFAVCLTCVLEGRTNMEKTIAYACAPSGLNLNAIESHERNAHQDSTAVRGALWMPQERAHARTCRAHLLPSCVSRC